MLVAGNVFAEVWRKFAEKLAITTAVPRVQKHEAHIELLISPLLVAHANIVIGLAHDAADFNIEIDVRHVKVWKVHCISAAKDWNAAVHFILEPIERQEISNG